MNVLQLYTHLDEQVGSIDLHSSLQTFSIRTVCQLRTAKSILALNTTIGKKNVYKRGIKMKNNAVQNESTISGVYCSSRSFEHIFPTILKTVHSDKSNSSTNS